MVNYYTANSIKFDIDNSERGNMSDQRVSRENAVSNKISTLVVLQDYKYSVSYDIYFTFACETVVSPIIFCR